MRSRRAVRGTTRQRRAARSIPEHERADRAERARRVGAFVAAFAFHALVTVALARVFAGDSGAPGPVRSIVGLLVGAPWLVWSLRLPWTVRDLFRSAPRSLADAPPADPRAGDPGAGVEVAADVDGAEARDGSGSERRAA